MQEVTVNTQGGAIRFETGRIARQADGAVVIRHRDTVLLATAVAAAEPKPGVDFFPLTVEYRERLSAAGRIPGAYQRREGRITDHEVLASRLADRSIRPLFPEDFTVETQVLLTVLSADDEVEPESLAIIGAAAALHLSSIPWEGPLAGVRICRALGEWHVFPTRGVRQAADLDLVVSQGPGGLVMVEGQAQEASEGQVLEALERARKVCLELTAGLDRLRELAGKAKKVLVASDVDPVLAARVAEAAAVPLEAALAVPGKAERREAVARAEAETAALLAAEYPEREAEVASLIHDLGRTILRRRALAGLRADGRGPTDIRPIWSETGWLPRCHGSAIFTRGETQALISATLGTGMDEQKIETLAGEVKERFLLHYNFPPYSVGEVRALRGPGRREIGHGNLAHRALEPLLPAAERFPYTIRLVSDISESNGSSSMATVCGGSLALMDAGVPMERPVAGIAMGMIAEGGQFVVLSDILGDEDHLGDMDFKIAGTAEGITAIQMDNKVGALPAEVLSGALEQARQGRLHILGKMAETLAASRPELHPKAPRMVALRIRPERIRDLIGSGGRTIQEIQATSGATVNVSDDGLVKVFCAEAAGLAEALRRIRQQTLEPEVGMVYDGLVTGVTDFNAFVRLGAVVEGRLHVSELDRGRVGRVQDLLKVGDTVRVRVMGVDHQGKIVLSRRAALGADDSEVVAL